MERDSVQDVPPGARQLAPGQWRLSLLVAGVVIILFGVGGWIYSQAQGNQAATAFNDGNTYAGQGDVNNAIASYDQAIKLQPNFPEAYYRRGLAYATKGLLDVAISDFTQAITLKSNYAEAYYNRAIAYQKKNQKDAAVADLQKVLSLSQDAMLRQQANTALATLGGK